MEKDRDFESVRKWYMPADAEEALAFEYLSEVVKNIFLDTEEGVKLSELSEFLQEKDLTLDMVRAVRFDTLQHFLFHLDNLLEVRGKKINGRIFYFAFIKEKLRRETRKLVGISDQKVGCVYHQSSFLASYSKILNLHRDMICATVTLFVPSLVILPSRKQKSSTVKFRDTVKTDEATGSADVKTTSLHLKYARPLPRKNEAPVRWSISSRPETVQKILRTHVFEPPDSRFAQYRVPGIGPSSSSSYKGKANIKKSQPQPTRF